MSTRLTFAYPAIVVVLIFAAALSYNGPGHSLPGLSVCIVFVFIWLSRSIGRLDLSRQRIILSGRILVAMGYLSWLLLNPLLSTYPYVSWATAMQLALLPLGLLGWLISSGHDKPQTWRITWRLLLAVSIVLAMWGMIDFLALKQRAHGPLIDANAYAALINLFLVPTTFGFLGGSPSTRGFNNPYLQLALIGLLTLAECMSLSLSGQLAFLAVLPLLLWLNRSRPGFRSRGLIMLLVLVSAYLIVQTLSFAPQRTVESVVLAPGQHLEENPNVNARFLVWKSTWKIIQDSNTLIGTGLGTYKNYYAAYRDPRETATSGNLAHNDYLQALQEGGLIQLTFLLLLVVLLPIWFLFFRNRRNDNPANEPDLSPGFLLAILCVSLHALVNFVHYVAPISVLTGLYLAHAWRTARPARAWSLPVKATQFIEPRFLKGFGIALLAIPTAVLVMDGIIFGLLPGKDSVFRRLEPQYRAVALSVALALRPGNPTPRTIFISQLVSAAEKARDPEIRAAFLAMAETEANVLFVQAPGLVAGEFSLGKILSLKGTPDDLLLARNHLEHAVKRLPAATGMRLELVKVYRKLGQEKEAYHTIVEAREWVGFEFDHPSLAAFAKEAQVVAGNQNDRSEAEFWAWVYTRLTESKTAS